MLKTAAVEIAVTRSICPGKSMILVGGDVDAVGASVEAGMALGGHQVVDRFIIPNVHPAVFPAVSGVAHVPEMKAFGIIESFSIAAIIEAAGAAVVDGCNIGPACRTCTLQMWAAVRQSACAVFSRLGGRRSRVDAN